MNSLSYCRASSLRLFAVFVLGPSFLLTGCSPKFDWRDIRHEAPPWIATFPGKPVEVSRTVMLPGLDRPVGLTLKSARVGQSMFAVGWVMAPKDRPETVANLEKIRRLLEESRLTNLQHDPTSIKRTFIDRSPILQHELSAKGSLRLDQAGPLVEARLFMRSLVVSDQQLVLEIIAVGPREELSEEIAEQFVRSLRLP